MSMGREGRNKLLYKEAAPMSDKSSNISKTTAINQCKRVPDLRRPRYFGLKNKPST